MLTMQYSLVLPAAFDMAAIRDRIAAKGPLLDDFPGLAFKAYLYACRGEHGPENLYAPFYLWADTAAMTRFLSGPGFAALTGDFGWPVVKTAVPLAQALRPGLREARFATRELRTIAPHVGLATLAEAERQAADADADNAGALAAVTAYDPSTWTLVRFRLWREPREAADGVQRYAVGHVSAPGA
ncbi:MAG: DUF4865 family protein [Burkholderiaceae bacterium]